MEVRIIGICPIIDKYNEAGDALLGEVDLFGFIILSVCFQRL